MVLTGYAKLPQMVDTYSITYKGQAPSLNDIYGSSNWRVRKGLVDKYKKIFTILLLERNPPKYEKYKVSIFYNSRHDCDNVVGAVGKILNDTLKTKWVPEDGPKFCKGISAEVDTSLEHNEFKIVITNANI